jgi:hypothetical protein
MSIKAKLTAVAIATVSSVLSFSVPSQAGEYGYLHELEIMVENLSEQEGVNEYSDILSVSEKLEFGKRNCDFLEDGSTEDLYSAITEKSQNMPQEGYSDQQVDDFIAFSVSMIYASVKELCPEYKYKVDIVN